MTDQFALSAQYVLAAISPRIVSGSSACRIGSRSATGSSPSPPASVPIWPSSTLRSTDCARSTS